MTPLELRAWLLAALGRLAPRFPGEIGDDTALADGGLCLDSLALMELLAEISQTLALPLRESDVTPEKFGTVARLLHFLRTAPV